MIATKVSANTPRQPHLMRHASARSRKAERKQDLLAELERFRKEHRHHFGLDQPGAQVEVIEREGEIVLRPHVAVPADQAWFWTERWQQLEREADDAVAAGRVTVVESVDELLADLDC